MAKKPQTTDSNPKDATSNLPTLAKKDPCDSITGIVNSEETDLSSRVDEIYD